MAENNKKKHAKTTKQKLDEKFMTRGAMMGGRIGSKAAAKHIHAAASLA